MTNKPVKLYNAIFPIWILIIFPTTWLIVLPANFVIDLLVMLITLKCMKVPISGVTPFLLFLEYGQRDLLLIF